MESYPAEPFFLETSLGKRFCLYYPPAKSLPGKGAFIYIHPFAEEMNKSRRMAAMQSRSFAKRGVAVLQIDLYGCGDSDGDFGDAAWETWKNDIDFAWQWLNHKGYESIYSWGLRLGALLALDCARESKYGFEKHVLWQPVINGKSFMTQFLRLKLANGLMTGEKGEALSVKGLREMLNRGQSLEIAGYMLDPQLAAVIDNLRMNDLVVKKGCVHWFETVPDVTRALSTAGKLVLDAWRQFGVNPEITLISGQPFWATQEISECPQLITATTQLFTQPDL